MLYRATGGIVGHENTQKMNGTLLKKFTIFCLTTV